MKVVEVKINEPFCEHCGDLGKRDKCFFDGSTYWCECCIECEGAIIVSSKEEL